MGQKYIRKMAFIQSLEWVVGTWEKFLQPYPQDREILLGLGSYNCLGPNFIWIGIELLWIWDFGG